MALHNPNHYCMDRKAEKLEWENKVVCDMQLVKAQLTWKNAVAILDAGARHRHMVRVIHWNALQRVECPTVEKYRAPGQY